MRVLLHNRQPDTWRGGDARVVGELSTALTAIGVSAHQGHGAPDAGRYDVVHLHNVSMPWTWEAMRALRHTRTPVVLTPIFEPEQWRLVARRHQCDTVARANAIICHSGWERGRVIDELGADPARVHVVHLGINPALTASSPVGDRKYVLQVGRIEPRKNQLAVVQAVTEVPLLLVGDPFDAAYYAEVLKAAGPNMLHLTHVDDEWLPLLYGNAKVFCSPTRFETVGLASLEAGLAGCRVVTTNVGGVREYCLDWVSYANPDDVADIRRRTMEAWHGRSNDFAAYIRTSFHWDRCARAHHEVYQAVAAAPGL